MIVGVVLDGQGRPICCELWPGSTVDVSTLIPVVDRLRQRFAVAKVCIRRIIGRIDCEGRTLRPSATEKKRTGNRKDYPANRRASE